MGFVDIMKRIVPDSWLEKASRAVEAEYYDLPPNTSVWGKEQPKGRGTYEDYLDTYGANVWLYVAITRIYNSCGQVPLKVWQRDPEKLEEHEAWQQVAKPDDPLVHILEVPNPYMTWQELLEFTIGCLDLTGNAYWEIVNGSNGQSDIPNELYPILPHRMKVIPDPKKYIKGYIYEVKKERVEFKPEEILHFKYPNFKDHYYGFPGMKAAENTVIVDMFATIYQRAFFKNSAIPAAVLQTDQELSAPVIRRAKREWNKLYQGPSKAFFTAILEQGLKYQGIALSNRDMQFPQLKKILREEVLAIYGVPPIVAGLVDSSSYSSADQQWKQYWSETVFPKLKRFETFMNRFFVPRFGIANRVVEFDTDALMATRADKESEAKIASTYIDRGMKTINEWRKVQGLNPVEWGDVWWVPANLSPGGNTQIGGTAQSGGGLGPLGTNPSDQGPYPSQQGIGKGTIYLPANMLHKLLTAKSESEPQEDSGLSPFQKAKLKQLMTRSRKSGWPGPMRY